MRRVTPESKVNMAPQHQGIHNRGPAIGDRITHSLRRRSRKPDRSPINPFVKYTLFLMNCVFLLLGLAIGTLGTYVLVQKDKTVDSFADFIFDPACLFCLVGSVATVVAFFGCGGSLRENICFLRVYYITLSLLLLLEIVVIVFVFVFYYVEGAAADIGLYPEDTFRDAIRKYRDPNSEDSQNFIDDLQEKFSCCGASNDDQGYLDWNDNPYFNCSSQSPEACSVPFSCCIHGADDNINYQCGADVLKGENLNAIYRIGCLKGIYNWITDNIWIVGGGILGVILPQAIFICFSKALVAQIQEQMSKW